MIEHVLDLAQLLGQLDEFPAILVGHSLGGAIVLQYAGVYPAGVAKVVAIEGLGPPPEAIGRQKASAHERMQDWIAQMREFARRAPRRYRTLDEAVRRMREANSHLSEEQARHLTVHGTNRNEDGTYTWKFDNYVRAHSPYRFNVEDAWDIWGRIECPVLLVRGAESWASAPTRDGRARAFGRARAVTIAGAGHWVHHDRLEDFLGELQAFLAEE
jgi:pimeloyl-ACP methyl ester carboxylesterase